MLIYHPAFDASHCAFRILKLFNTLSDIDFLELDRIKIIDFYIVFPKTMKYIKYPQNIDSKKIRKELNLINNTYRPCRNPYLISKKMSIIQDKVLSILVTNEYLSFNNLDNSYSKGQKFNQLSLKSTLFENSLKYEIEVLVLKFLLTHPINNKDGLKDRTSLMEFRYDN